jgi:hypothetical protein
MYKIEPHIKLYVDDQLSFLDVFKHGLKLENKYKLEMKKNTVESVIPTISKKNKTIHSTFYSDIDEVLSSYNRYKTTKTTCRQQKNKSIKTKETKHRLKTRKLKQRKDYMLNKFTQISCCYICGLCYDSYKHSNLVCKIRCNNMDKVKKLQVQTQQASRFLQRCDVAMLYSNHEVLDGMDIEDTELDWVRDWGGDGYYRNETINITLYILYKDIKKDYKYINLYCWTCIGNNFNMYRTIVEGTIEYTDILRKILFNT